MQRRKLVIATGGLIATATAGCLGPDSETTPEVEVEFTVDDGDLVVMHVSGDVLQSGQTVYVTAEGEKIAENTLKDSVHTGSEIIRIHDFRNDYSWRIRTGLYLTRNGDPQELGVSTVETGPQQSTPNSPAPNAQIAFDYDAGTSQVEVNHDGGDTITADNTGKLSISGDVAAADVAWANALSGGSGNLTTKVPTGTTIVAGDNIATISAIATGDKFSIQWRSNDSGTSLSLGTFEAP